MRAVAYTRTGSSDVLELVDRAEPQAGPGEVRVHIQVSGVNPTDWKARAGSGESVELGRTQVPNQDGAGEVDQVGPGVEGFSVGDRVWVWDAAFQRADGTAQELVVIPSEQVVALPAGASFDLGASLGIPALTAHRALTSSEYVPDALEPGALAGHTILVAGGAGAVGHAAIQLAVWAGATVLTTVSSDSKAALARAAGADHVINYRAEDAATAIEAVAPNGVDLIVEVSPGANMDLDERVTAPNASIAIYADAGAAVTVPVRPSMAKNLRFQFILTYTTPPQVKAAALRAVSAAVADGALSVGEDAGLPIRRFTLSETAAAHDAVEQGFVGKVLIDIR